MKFPTTYDANSKAFHIDKLNGGLDFSQNAHAENFNCLADCKNVWFNNGVLKSRPGLSCSPENILNNQAYQNGYHYYYHISNIEITVEEELKKIIIEEIDYNESMYICLTHFINPDGTTWNTAEMTFFRSSGSAFYIPSQIVFFKGMPKNGSGLFALANLVNIEDFSQSESRIYELNSEFTDWEMTINTYIPTVFINGRGNEFQIAASTNQAFMGTPTRLEKLNLLNGQFHAYYSTDGHSSSFRLPFSNIANDTVSCRFYYKLNSYIEWKIGAGKTSASNTFNEVKITMNVDRAKGIVYFTAPAGDYGVPLMSHQNENNLRFTATKTCDYGLSDVASSGHSISVNSKIVLANKNIIFEADYNNPLYFPADSVTAVGESDAEITAFSVLKDDIIAFKSEETYLIGIKNGKALNSISLLADNDSVFYANDTMNVECISPQIGCPDKNSLITFDRQLFWRGADGYIYTLNSSSKQVFCVSQKVNSYLDGNISPSAYTYGLKYGNYNIIIMDNSAIVMEYNSENFKFGENINWYYWDFPKNLRVLGTLTLLGKPWILCRNTEYDLCFMATLSGETDTLLFGSVYEPETTEIPIKSFLRTKKLSFGCDSVLKKIESIILQLDTNRASIRINDRLEAKICRHEKDDIRKSIKLTPGLCGFETIDVTIESDTGFSLGSIDIKYTELKL